MKTLIILVITIAGLIGILAWLGAVNTGGNSQSSEGPAVLSAAEDSFDFGTVSMADGKVSYRFSVINTVEKEIKITAVYTSCMCTEAILTLNGENLGPFGMPGHGGVPRVNKNLGIGEEAVVEVVFDPAAHGPAGVGLIERVVYLENDSGAPLVLMIKALVTP
ncbi:MAG: DUF1573 domain-containing protein [Parcubacteria group bacterium]|nr:DUF1573 domain-containing protein [Parcubacteria group bacterium]